MWRILQLLVISTQRSCYRQVHQRAARSTQTFGTRWGSSHKPALASSFSRFCNGRLGRPLHFILETHLASVYNKRELGHCFGNMVCPRKIVAKLFSLKQHEEQFIFVQKVFLSVVAPGSQTHLVCPLSFPPPTNI